MDFIQEQFSSDHYHLKFLEILTKIERWIILLKILEKCKTITVPNNFLLEKHVSKQIKNKI